MSETKTVTGFSEFTYDTCSVGASATAISFHNYQNQLFPVL